MDNGFYHSHIPLISAMPRNRELMCKKVGTQNWTEGYFDSDC